MQAIEIPDKAENEIHIFLKRDSNFQNPQDMSSVPAKLDAIEKMFLQFSSVMQKGMQDVLVKMTNIQDLMVTIANHQQHDVHHEKMEESREVQQEHLYHTGMHDEGIQLQEEEHILGGEVEDDVEIENTEYIIDIDEEHIEEEELPVVATPPVKRRDTSQSSRPGPKSKKQKKETVQIQNYVDETRMATEELLHIVESTAACQSIQSNVDSEEVINTTSYSYKTDNPLTDIKIQHDTKYELPPVTEELEFDFPLTSLDDLKRLNNFLTNDERMVDAMKHKLIEISTAVEFNFQKALQKLLSDNVMHQLNWQGLKGKFRMKDMLLFGQILYQTWFQHIDFETYEELLKVITKKAHKRYSKTMERRRHRIQGGPNRLIQGLAGKDDKK